MSQDTQEIGSEVGDFSGEEFKAYGYEVVDWIARYLDHPEAYPVLSQVVPGQVRDALPPSGPEQGQAFDDILRDFESVVLPGITHWNHPGFFAYFGISGSVPGILGEMLTAALNVNGMLWRTSPAATELEAVSLDWLRQWLGLPGEFEGIIYDTASISTLVALASARERLGLNVRELGMTGRHDLPRLRVYCSDQAHSSVEKAAIVLGLGQSGVRKIGTDDEYRMDVGELRRALDEDLAEGVVPCCVVAAAGTTSTTSVDPIPEIAELCRSRGVWLHVDAAYAGVAAILPEMDWILRGAELADSIVVNPHKWLFTPIDCSCLYSPHLNIVRQAFSLVPEYLRTPEDETARNYMDYGPQLGRRFRALKLWFVLRSYGRYGIEERIRNHIEMAAGFVHQLRSVNGWDVSAPARLSTVCFRAVEPGFTPAELDDLNASILERVNASGEVFLSHTVLREGFVLRLAIGNIRTQTSHVSRVWDLLQDARSAVLSGGRRSR